MYTYTVFVEAPILKNLYIEMNVYFPHTIEQNVYIYLSHIMILGDQTMPPS